MARKLVLQQLQTQVGILCGLRVFSFVWQVI